MADPKPIAQLSPSLLARKGGALPAMRSHANAAPRPSEDLGFNDMGDDAEVIAFKPGVAITQSFEPEVVRQQAQVAARMSKKGSQRKSALAEGRSAAFTLRLDAQRHLQLRMACTLANRSAQQLITDALDQMIAGLPDVAILAAEAAKRR
jgi:hypothetical protein